MARLSQERAVLIIVATGSIAFLWLIYPLAKPILWAIVAAIVFKPLERKLLARMPGRRNVSASFALVVMIAVIAIPAALLASAVFSEATGYYAQATVQTDFANRISAAQDRLPRWAANVATRFQLTDIEAWASWARSSFASGARGIAAGFLSIGQSVVGILLFWGVMLYLSFFLLRDGDAIVTAITRASPLESALHQTLTDRFVAVVRATLRGTFVVAFVQGLLGGLIFWAVGLPAPALWGAAMATASLIPSVGTGLVWVPVGLFLLITGNAMQGTLVLFSGAFVIGLVDNLLRPALIGKDASIPDYIVLIAILGGIQLFGFSGLIIGPAIAALFLSSWKLLLDAQRGLPAE